MTTETSLVGANEIPLATGGQDSAIHDLTVHGIADFAAYVIKDALDDKLAEMRGPTTSAAITDACPAANRFYWAHNGTFMRTHPATGSSASPLPGIWVYRTSIQETDDYATILEPKIESEIHIVYVFPPVQIPDGYDARSGLVAIVGQQLARYFSRARGTRHPSYGYNGAAPGTPLFVSLNCDAIEFVRCAFQPLAMTPAGGVANSGGVPGNQGHVQRFYPSVDVTLRVIEGFQEPQAVYPDDYLADSLFTMEVGEQPGDTIEFGQGVFVSPTDLVDP